MIQRRFTLLVICFFCLQSLAFAALNTVQNLQRQVGNIELSSSEQKKLEIIDDQAQLQREVIRNLDHEIRLQARYQQQLTKQFQQLENAIEHLDDKMENIRQTKVNLYPLLEQMTKTLEELVLADIPFDRDSRLERVQQLALDLDNPQLSDAEKLERILVAYQTEIQYGSQVKAWFGRLTANQEVQYLRVGRLGYYYLALNGATAGVWHSEGQQWVTLSMDETKLVKQALTLFNSRMTYPVLTLPKGQ
ncbi:hypothetical protein CEQ50_00765 [Vibrio anguillarum]|uniref:DUF3450 family protein n=1 Tax=Vibrio anguillarum TaxID=55601 RepID=UPI000B544EEF|nr:DUF3450 family protein [Vibrio anguillarum]ASG06202.1 hypothetical protein CEQ50_00765 [Vibrio anguillarum]